MKKLKLNLDEIKVDSFETSELKEGNKGTVQGNAPETEVSCLYSCPNTCDPHRTCFPCGYDTIHESCDWCNP